MLIGFVLGRSRRQRSAVEKLLKEASVLSVDEMEALLSGVEGLLEAALGEKDEFGKPRSQAGYIEKKWINGCDPYRYLRYCEGNKHRSIYLEKVDD